MTDYRELLHQKRKRLMQSMEVCFIESFVSAPQEKGIPLLKLKGREKNDNILWQHEKELKTLRMVTESSSVGDDCLL